MIPYLSAFIMVWLFLEFAVYLSRRDGDIHGLENKVIVWLGKVFISLTSTLIFYILVKTLEFILELIKEYNIV